VLAIKIADRQMPFGTFPRSEMRFAEYATHYFCIPADENEYHAIPGSIAIKPGIHIQDSPPGKYCRERYGAGTDLLHARHYNMTRAEIEQRIEQPILKKLDSLKCTKRIHGKKEHFLVKKKDLAKVQRIVMKMLDKLQMYWGEEVQGNYEDPDDYEDDDEVEVESIHDYDSDYEP